MMFDKVIDDGTLKARPDGFSVGVRLPWYRALPLSTISVNALRIDGRAVDGGKITFVLDGVSASLGELETRFEDMWFTTDAATLEVSGMPIHAASDHQIEAEIEIRPPYIKGLRRVGRVTKMMKAQ